MRKYTRLIRLKETINHRCSDLCGSIDKVRSVNRNAQRPEHKQSIKRKRDPRWWFCGLGHIVGVRLFSLSSTSTNPHAKATHTQASKLWFTEMLMMRAQVQTTQFRTQPGENMCFSSIIFIHCWNIFKSYGCGDRGSNSVARVLTIMIQFTGVNSRKRERVHLRGGHGVWVFYAWSRNS